MNPGKLMAGFIMGLWACPFAWALQSDRDKPIDIKANRVVVNDKQGISHYSGNVLLTQGSLIIKADEIIVYLMQGRLEKIFITGKPASFEQQPENRREIVKSRAEQMEYFSNKEFLILKQNAEVLQGGNHFQGDHIEYDTYNSVVRAKKEANSQSRVHAIIQPRDAKQDQKDKPGKP